MRVVDHADFSPRTVTTTARYALSHPQPILQNSAGGRLDLPRLPARDGSPCGHRPRDRDRRRLRARGDPPEGPGTRLQPAERALHHRVRSGGLPDVSAARKVSFRYAHLPHVPRRLVRSRDRFFREDSIHPDSDLCFELLGQYKFGWVHSVLSFTRVDNLSISSAIQDFQPDARYEYLLLRNYGRLHLTDVEYARCLVKARKEYYGLLAYHVFRVRDKKFWEFHEEAFRIADDRLNWGALLLLQIPRVLRWIGNPLSTLEAPLGRSLAVGVGAMPA